VSGASDFSFQVSGKSERDSCLANLKNKLDQCLVLFSTVIAYNLVLVRTPRITTVFICSFGVQVPRGNQVETHENMWLLFCASIYVTGLIVVLPSKSRR
jgi:hypothetical protein